MGNLERVSAQRRKKASIQRFVIGAIATAGLLSVAVVVPNALSLLKMAGFKPHARQEEIIKRTTKDLVGQGILEWSNGKLRLTDRGRRDYEREQAAQQTTARSLKWDGAWRVLIFDIPEHRRKQRLQLRFQLKRIGFIRLQDSVWVYPYDCEDFVVLLKADLKIGKDLLYIIADSLEGDEPLRKHFKLKQRQ